MTDTHILIDAINDNADPRGPDRYLLELLPHLLSVDPSTRITLLYAPWQRAFSALTAIDRLTTVETPTPRKPLGRLIWHATCFAGIAHSHAADVVFLPNLIWTPRLRIPSVITAHDLLHFRTPEKFGTVKAAILRRVIRLALARASRVIAVSQFTASDAETFAAVPRDKLRVVLEGGPDPRPRDKAAVERRFLFVGKVERSKGINTLIDAFIASERLAQAGYGLVIVGPPGNASSDIAARLNALHPVDRARIDLPGFVPETTLEHLYLTSRAFVFPSVSEGFGLVLLEAMARGAPVIAANATSLPEVLGDAGLLVPPNDSTRLRLAMERLAFDDALCDDLHDKGRARLACFAWEKAGRETSQVLQEFMQ